MWVDNIAEAFAFLHEEGGASFNLTLLHPWIAGQAHRIRWLREALRARSAADTSGAPPPIRWHAWRTRCMQTRRIGLLLDVGAAVTTLGRAVADALAIPHHDTDGFHWLPTDPPYTRHAIWLDALRLMHEMFIALGAQWLAGRVGWSGARAVRSRGVSPAKSASSAARSRIASRLRVDEDFLEWAAHYDDGTREDATCAS